MPRQLDDWVEGFRFMTSEAEAPDSYFTWTAYATISAALQRRVYTHWIYWKYYPNIYVLLVGPAGRVHKSSTIRFARKFLQEIGVATASEAITKEALIQQMKHRGSGGNDSLAVTSSEFASFIAPSGPRMVEFLTDIYDCDDGWEYTTKGGGTDRIDKPYLTLLGGTVPTWIANEFDESFIEGGFASRTLFVYENAPRFRKAFANVTDEMMRMRAMLVNDLEVIASLEGEYVWSKDAVEWFEDWYENRWPMENLDYRLSGYLARKPTHVVRLSMVIAASRRNDLVITANEFEEARGLLTSIEPSMVEAFSSVGRNPYALDMERIAEEIILSGGMSKGELIKRNTHAMDRRVLDELLENITLMGEVSLEIRKGQQWYVPRKD